MQKWLKKRILLEPMYFGGNMRNLLQEKLCASVEGKVLGRFGFCIAVVNVKSESIGMGEIDDDTGAALYNLDYEAILFRPFRAEVLDGKIDKLSEVLSAFC